MQQYHQKWMTFLVFNQILEIQNLLMFCRILQFPKHFQVLFPKNFQVLFPKNFLVLFPKHFQIIKFRLLLHGTTIYKYEISTVRFKNSKFRLKYSVVWFKISTIQLKNRTIRLKVVQFSSMQFGSEIVQFDTKIMQFKNMLRYIRIQYSLMQCNLIENKQSNSGYLN